MRHPLLFKRLMFNSLLTLIPMVALIGIVLWSLMERERQATLEALKFGEAQIALSVNGEIARVRAVGDVLARNPVLNSDAPIEDIRTIVERYMPSLPGVWVVVGSPEGYQIFNQRAQPGEPLPMRNAGLQKAQATAFAENRSVIAGMDMTPFSGVPAATITWPIFKDGKAYRALTLAMPASLFANVGTNDALPSNWLTGVVDERQRFVMRSLFNESYVGKSPAIGWREAMNHSPDGGSLTFRSLENHPMLSYWKRDPETGWTVGVSTRSDLLFLPYRNYAITVAAVSIALLVMSATVSALLARRVSNRPDPSSAEPSPGPRFSL